MLWVGETRAENTMTFQEAVEHLKAGKKVVLTNRKGGKLVIGSPKMAMAKMTEADFLSDEWELFEKKKEAK